MSTVWRPIYVFDIERLMCSVFCNFMEVLKLVERNLVNTTLVEHKKVIDIETCQDLLIFICKLY